MRLVGTFYGLEDFGTNEMNTSCKAMLVSLSCQLHFLPFLFKILRAQCFVFEREGLRHTAVNLYRIDCKITIVYSRYPQLGLVDFVMSRIEVIRKMPLSSKMGFICILSTICATFALFKREPKRPVWAPQYKVMPFSSNLTP